MRVDVLTLFPPMFEGFLSCSIPRIAQQKGLLDVNVTDIRQFADDKRGTVDDKPFGGGAGMLLMCAPIFRAVETVEGSAEDSAGDSVEPASSKHEDAPVKKPRRLLMSPQGRPLTQELVEELAREDWLLLLCGHYEGFDERIRIGLEPEEISVGDYVLSGGELPAMTLIDAVTRLLPGVVGDPESVRGDSFSWDNRGLEYPHYTRPREFRGMQVPEVLLSGNHARIAQWRLEQGLLRTQERRPDLYRSLTETQDNQDAKTNEHPDQ